MPRWSVVMPVYNERDFLPRTLLSLAAQGERMAQRLFPAFLAPRCAARGLVLLGGALLLVAATPLPPRELRGSQDAECRPNEPGPALAVELLGLKDHAGLLRMELYPANDRDFLADDKALIAAGKPFRRIEVATPASGNPVLCIRAPRPGAYAVAILHDRDGNHRFGPFSDGVSAPGDIPHIGFSRPHASYATVDIGPGVTRMHATMQYMHVFGFAPMR